MSLPGRSVHELEIANHLWTTLETMALEMSTDVNSLVNLALFSLARQHGFVVPGGSVDSKPFASSPSKIPALINVEAGPGAPSALAVLSEANPNRAEGIVPKVEPKNEPKKTQAMMPLTTTSKDKLKKSKADQAKLRVKNDDADYLPAEAPTKSEVPQPPNMGRKAPKTASRKVFVHMEGREPTEILTARFVMGRDQVCQLPIQSARISRQHAVVFQEGNALVIEDMGSSNGTWFNQEKITKRPISDGEKYILGDVVVTFEIR